MVDTISSLASRVHDLLVTSMTNAAASVVPGQGALSSLARAFLGVPQSVDVTAGFHDVIARAGTLGPDGAFLVAAGHGGLTGLAIKHGQTEQALHHLDAAVTFGYNDCVALHMPLLRPLHDDPRFRALYQRMRITPADLDELYWLHQEIQIMSRDATRASIDNINRHDTGVALLPQAPLPTRTPNTAGLLISRIELAAAQTALQQAAMRSDMSRSSGNVSLSLIDDSWDYAAARRDAWRADDLESHRRQAAAARAFVERPGASTLVIPCPPLGSIVYPG
ncbi:hypothetical protein [Kitasatospora sp. NPDC097643]|uniref:hypothetical protein n=1 Tax=Kitasatospora sp. NPDC097643 TaxID=3157230 RepID=UPI00332527B2